MAEPGSAVDGDSPVAVDSPVISTKGHQYRRSPIGTKRAAIKVRCRVKVFQELTDFIQQNPQHITDPCERKRSSEAATQTMGKDPFALVSTYIH